MSDHERWWERTGSIVPYPELKQGTLPHCVYASIAGAVNHLAQQEIWKPQDLLHECLLRGQSVSNFDVADTAIQRVPELIEKLHHNRDWSEERLSASLIASWIESGAIVILSLQQSWNGVDRIQGWHMFTLMSIDGDRFQVWDTNGGQVIGGSVFTGRGFFTEKDVAEGVYYPLGCYFLPHDKEDTLVLRPRRESHAQ